MGAEFSETVTMPEFGPFRAITVSPSGPSEECSR